MTNNLTKWQKIKSSYVRNKIIDVQFVIATIIIIIGSIVGFYFVIKSANESRQFCADQCKPNYLITCDRVADGLQKISCMDLNGNKIEKYIPSDSK